MLVVRNTFALFCAISFLSGCGEIIDNLPAASSTFATYTQDYEYVVKIASPGGGMCTGSILDGGKAVLTAAHCTENNGTYAVITAFGTFYTSNVLRMSQNVGVGDPNDLALLYFNSPITNSGDRMVQIGYGVNQRDDVRLVGFGCNDIRTKTGAGWKRTGTNIVYDISSHLELVTPLTTGGGGRGVHGPENLAGSCNGDSGGPLLKDFGGELRAVGVAHSGGYDSQYAYSDYVSLDRSDNRGWLFNMNDNYSLDFQI